MSSNRLSSYMQSLSLQSRSINSLRSQEEQDEPPPSEDEQSPASQKQPVEEIKNAEDGMQNLIIQEESKESSSNQQSSMASKNAIEKSSKNERLIQSEIAQEDRNHEMVQDMSLHFPSDGHVSNKLESFAENEHE